MYKLILVDDEEEVRHGILEKIEWDKHGFEIAGEAENGLEALEIAEKTIPDIVITDIKMPFMDGLTLAKKIREKYPTTKIIILTGFDEFEYAKKAIQLNVVEYILKPISCKELVKVLDELKIKLDEEVAQKKDIEALKEYYLKSLPILREKFLGSLINGEMDKNEIAERARNYGLEISGRRFAVALINAEYNKKNPETVQDLNAPIEEENTETLDNGELSRFAVLNICEEIMDKQSSGIAFLHNDNIAIIFFTQEDDRKVALGKIMQVLEEIRVSVQKYHGFTVTIGLGSFCNDITDLNQSFKNAVNALDYSVVLGSNRVIFIEDVEPQGGRRVVFDEAKAHALSSCIKVGTTEEMSKTIGNLFSDIIAQKASFKDYQIYLLEMLTAILKVANDLSVDMENLFGSNYNLFTELDKFKDLEQVEKWIFSICVKIKKYISKNRQDTCKMIVNNAVEYLKANYSDSGITIDKVCSMLHISPTYFSTIFKRETKYTFINYLTHLRMETAKEILRSTNFKTFEIARMVGYSEPNYFSYCFKKNFGISPSEYRNRA